MLALLLALLGLIGGAPHAAPAAQVIGRSVQGRPIVAIERGDPLAARRVLVVGCIHGPAECAGVAVVRRLRWMPLPAGLDLWLVPNLNPDAMALGTRSNAHGVNLNRNFPVGWHPLAPGDESYPGTRPFSEPETAAARRLILRIHPTLTIWYHQHLDLVWAHGPSAPAGRRYAAVSGLRLYRAPWLWGTASHWQNVALHEHAFVVELPAGPLAPDAAARQARAVLAAATVPASSPTP
jgi:murein peptide amidase A